MQCSGGLGGSRRLAWLQRSRVSLECASLSVVSHCAAKQSFRVPVGVGSWVQGFLRLRLFGLSVYKSQCTGIIRSGVRLLHFQPISFLHLEKIVQQLEMCLSRRQKLAGQVRLSPLCEGLVRRVCRMMGMVTRSPCLTCFPLEPPSELLWGIVSWSWLLSLPCPLAEGHCRFTSPI